MLLDQRMVFAIFEFKEGNESQRNHEREKTVQVLLSPDLS